MNDGTRRNLKAMAQSAKYLPKRIARLERDRVEVESALNKLDYVLSQAKEQLHLSMWAIETIAGDAMPEFQKYIDEKESKEDE